MSSSLGLSASQHPSLVRSFPFRHCPVGARSRPSCVAVRLGASLVLSALIGACSTESEPASTASDAGASSLVVDAAPSAISFSDAASSSLPSAAPSLQDASPGAAAPTSDTQDLARDAAVVDAGFATVWDGGPQASDAEAGLLDASALVGDAGDMSHHDSGLDASASQEAGAAWPCGGLAPSYSSGLSATGPNGVQVTLNDADPAPPGVGFNVFNLSVRDDAGNTLSTAQLTVTPYMPQHHHGSPSVPEVEQLENGTYRVTRIEFTMPGYWELTIDVSSAGVDDSLRLNLCI